MTRFHKTLPRKVEFARDALVTLIHDRKMNAGDRLPAYSVLRKDLGLGKLLTCLDIFSDVGLLETQRRHKSILIRLTAGDQKADLTESNTMQILLRAKES